MKFLVFQHVPHEHPGLIAKYAAAKSIELDIVELWKPYRMPSMKDYDALVIMGGPMGVYEGKDAYPSKDDEVAVIQDALGKTPMIGLCLGHQLIAHALGADVYPNMKDGKRAKEIGYYTVDLTVDGSTDALFRGFPQRMKVLQWHGDASDLPRGAKLLATSDLCANQAFSYKNAYGILFHYEFTPEMVERQIEIDREWMHKDHEIDEAQLVSEARINARLMEGQCRQMFNNFVSLVIS